MEQRRNHHKGSGGFMLGVIIGVLITLLFTTKKGREILKELTEKGLDKFSDLEKRLQSEDDEFDTFVEEEDENDYVKPDQPTRHLAESRPAPEPAPKKEPVHHAETKKEAPAPKPAEPKEQTKAHPAPEHKKPEPQPAPKHEPEEPKEAPKKSGVRRFFRLKK